MHNELSNPVSSTGGSDQYTLRAETSKPKVTLGWLRVVLAFMVVDLHYGFFASMFDFIAGALHSTTRFRFCGDGDIAVSGFFIISGYLVSDILQKKYPSNSRRDFFHFVSSRYLRIFPLYLFVFVCFVTLSHLVGHVFGHWHIALNAILVPYGILGYFNYTGKPLYDGIIVGQTWTLALDLMLYPVGFLLIKDKRFLHITFVILLVFYFWVWTMSPEAAGSVRFDTASWWHYRFYSTIEPNMLAFVLGMVGNSYLKTARIPLSIVLASVISLIYVCYFPVFIDYFMGQFIGMVSLAVIVLSLGKRGISKHESLFGSFTYSLYLIHLPVVWLLGLYVPSRYVLFPIAIALSFIIAILIEERIVESRRKSWLGKWRPDGSEPAVRFAPYNAFILMCLIASVGYYCRLFLA